MSDKPLKVETKKRVKRTVTLYTEDGAHFECPVIQRVTGKVHDRVIPILEEYEKGLGEPVPEFIAVMQSLEGEEREAYVNAHAVEIGTYVQTVTGALTKLQQSNEWVDLGRHFVPAPGRLFTWWSYRSPDWTKNDRGRRLDHMWATKDVAALAVGHQVYEPCRNWTRPSDHVPLMTEFAI